MMYGVVLLMAVTAGGESADLGHRSKGCCGYSSCCGYVSSCRGCYGCCGYVSSCRGCYGCGGCYGGGGYGCCGGSAPSYGCCGSAPSYGCGGSAPSYGCGGGISYPQHGHAHGKHASAASPNAATVVVTLPADAKLTIDGAATTSTSAERTFETPELVAGKTYAYTLEATFQKDGKAVVVSKKVKIEAGKTATVDLNSIPATGVARN